MLACSARIRKRMRIFHYGQTPKNKCLRNAGVHFRTVAAMGSHSMAPALFNVTTFGLEDELASALHAANGLADERLRKRSSSTPQTRNIGGPGLTF